MKKLFVTGLNGRTGRYLLEELLKDNDFEIYASTRSNTNFDKKINKVNLDLENEKEVINTLKNIDIVFHIAGIQKSINVIKASLINNVDWVILVHTTGIYSKYKAASQEYLKIEKEISELIKYKNINVTILRPTMIFGSLDDQNMSVFIKMIDKLKLFPVVNGAKYDLQPISQKDLGYAYYQVLKNEEKTKNKNYDLSGEKPIQLIEILKIISINLNKKPIFINIPYSLSYFMALLLYYFTFKKIDIREKVQRLVEPRAYSHKYATADFGFKPNSFEERIKEEIEIYKNSR